MRSTIKTAVIVTLITVSIGLTAAQGNEACTYEGGMVIADSFDEPYQDSAKRETMWKGVSHISTSTDTEEKTITFSSDLNLLVFTSVQGDCPETVEKEIRSTKDASIELDIGANGGSEWSGEIPTNEVKSIPVSISASHSYTGNATEITEEELQRIKNSLGGGATLSYEVDIEKSENVDDQSTVFLLPGRSTEETETSGANLLGGMQSYTMYNAGENPPLNSNYQAYIRYTNDYRHDFNAYIWKTAYARPVGENPDTLDEYKDLPVHYQNSNQEYIQPEAWITPERRNGRIALDELSKDEEWLIFPASCIPREDSDYFIEKTNTIFFHKVHRGLTNDNWACGFNDPLYLPSAGSGESSPPAFE